MGFSKWLCAIGAFAAFAPALTATAQDTQVRVSRPALAALARPAASPEERLARLPETRQAQLTALADREPLTGGALSPASSNALAGMAGTDMDIASLTTIVMMLVARDADADLRDVMSEMSAARESNREVGQGDCPPQSAATSNTEEIIVAIPELRGIRDGVDAINSRAAQPSVTATAPSGQGARPALPPRPTLPCLEDEMAALRLQAAMDRRSAAQAMLSNMLRRQSETSESITQNLK